MLTIDELKERIMAEGYDECLLCDILEIEPKDILDKFSEKLIEKKEEFLDKST